MRRTPFDVVLSPAALVAATAALFLTGCPLGHMSPPARAQEAATELNVNSRFGRMEVATEQVAPAQREAFLERHKAWGGAVRIADYEMAGFKMKGEEDAETLVRISWYRVEQGDLRNTLLRQKWHDFKGSWRLVDESRAEGDIGVFGEPSPLPAGGSPDASAPKKTAQFPTIRLGNGDPAAQDSTPDR